MPTVMEGQLGQKQQIDFFFTVETTLLNECQPFIWLHISYHPQFAIKLTQQRNACYHMLFDFNKSVAYIIILPEYVLFTAFLVHLRLPMQVSAQEIQLLLLCHDLVCALVQISNASAYVSFLCMNTTKSGGCIWLKVERRLHAYTILPSRCLSIIISGNKREKSKSHKKKEKALKQNNLKC